MPRATDLHQYDELEPRIPGLEPNREPFHHEPIANQPFEPLAQTEPIPVEITHAKTHPKTQKEISGLFQTFISTLQKKF